MSVRVEELIQWLQGLPPNSLVYLQHTHTRAEGPCVEELGGIDLDELLPSGAPIVVLLPESAVAAPEEPYP